VTLGGPILGVSLPVYVWLQAEDPAMKEGNKAGNEGLIVSLAMLGVTDPKVGAYCTITLDREEKIVVSHDKPALTGGSVTIERLKLLGFSSHRLLACDLDREPGRSILEFLTRDAEASSRDATPLGAFVKYLKTCRSAGEVVSRCAALLASHGMSER